MKTTVSGVIVAFPGEPRGNREKHERRKSEKSVGGRHQPISVSYVFAFLVVDAIDFVDCLGCSAGCE